MKIYYAGSIRGGQMKQRHEDIIEILKKHGTVLTEHLSPRYTQKTRGAQNIKAQDLTWLKEADVIVAEVSKPSHGVGYELGIAESLEKPIILLKEQRALAGKISAMLSGIPVIYYRPKPTNKLLAKNASYSDEHYKNVLINIGKELEEFYSKYV